MQNKISLCFWYFLDNAKADDRKVHQSQTLPPFKTSSSQQQAAFIKFQSWTVEGYPSIIDSEDIQPRIPRID